MALTPAYAVDGGRIDARMFRSVAWAATSGAAGIVNATDLRVTPLAVPGTKVNIGPGGALLPMRFAGASSTQSYAVINDAVMQLDIPATGSASGRTDYIIIRIDDWHFTSAQPPADPVAATYCSVQRVSSIASLAYPFVVLAKITLPPSTGTITSAMITDLREVANPRTKRVLRVNPQSTPTTETLSVTAVTGEYFPNVGGTQRIDIPSWATRVKIRGDWLQMWQLANSTCNVWVEFGDWTGARFEVATEKFAVNTPNVGTDMRTCATAVGDLWVPPKYRGRDQVTFQMKAQKTAGTTRFDSMCGVSLDVLFEEVADPSDS